MAVNSKNWQELKKPNSLERRIGGDARRRASFVAEPLERGFGMTLGNSLRRVLLSSLQGADAMFGGLLAGVFRRDLGRVGGRLAAALEAHHPGRTPRDRIALRVGDGDHRVVEAGVHMRDAGSDVLAFPPAEALGCLSH